MFKKEELKTLKLEFWESFKHRMAKHKSANGKKITWISYPSGVKDLYIRCDVDQHGARLCLDIQGKDDGIRAIFWEQLMELKTVMENEMGTDGVWLENQFSMTIPKFHQIRWENTDVSLFKKEDHKEIAKFLENRLRCFDRFYQEYNDILILLAN